MNNIEKINILKELSNLNGVSGGENNVSMYISRFLFRYTNDINIDSMGNVIANISKAHDGYKNILLDAHIDQIGMIVTYIDDGGFLKVSNVGGVDRRLLLAQNVIVHTKNGPIHGTISSKPPHLIGEDGDSKSPEISDIAIDIGFSRESAEKIVSLGDRVSFDTKAGELLNGNVFGSALDDRAGAVSILSVIDILKDKSFKCGLTVLFSTQEEVGIRGAKTGGFDISPDIAIAVDVSFGFTPDAVPHKCGKMGGGPMIGIAPTLDNKISKEFIDIADKNNIPYQLEVMSGTTGTNADEFGIIKSGVKVGLLSIPLKYMHTPIEVIQIDDIDNLSKLLSAYILKEGL